jgi:TRAP-type mannitol/chloroaromatic compound transport system substrate-binding protein
MRNPRHFDRACVRHSCLLVILLLLAAGCPRSPTADGPPGTAAKKMRLTVASEFQMNLPVLGSTLQGMADQLAAVSDGMFTFNIYEPGELVPKLETLNAVSEGKIDVAYSVSGYWAGKMAAAPLFSSMPFGPEIGEYLAWMQEGNGMKLYQKMYDRAGFKVKVLVCGVLPPETSGWFARPIQSVDDLKGLKMRFFGLGGRVMEKLGVAVTLLSSADIFQALEKGVIDATEYSLPAIDQKLGFHTIVKHNYYPGWHQQTTLLELLVNKQTWDRMSSSRQTLLRMACGDAVARSIAEGEGTQFQAMRKNVEKNGVTNETWSPQMLDLFRSTWEQVARDECARDAFFKEVYEDLVRFRTDYDLWETSAFLPRTTQN